MPLISRAFVPARSRYYPSPLRTHPPGPRGGLARPATAPGATCIAPTAPTAHPTPSGTTATPPTERQPDIPQERRTTGTRSPRTRRPVRRSHGLRRRPPLREANMPRPRIFSDYLLSTTLLPATAFRGQARRRPGTFMPDPAARPSARRHRRARFQDQMLLSTSRRPQAAGQPLRAKPTLDPDGRGSPLRRHQSPPSPRHRGGGRQWCGGAVNLVGQAHTVKPDFPNHRQPVTAA